MKAQILEKSRQLGFDACHFTTAQPPETSAQFQRWLQSGYHGQMGYLARNEHKRIDPQLVLPGARSIITLAVSYAQGLPSSRRAQANNLQAHVTPELELAPPSGTIARYARYSDYHTVLGQRLEDLSHFVSQLGGGATRSLWYVDTGPVLERDLAQRAGLGFIGKHTNLISRKLGNWIFLAEIITTLELESDAPERNHCGSCNRCLTACPTQAITAPFQLDARRCISYLTIELKGAIPVELRPALGNRIYGCDDCLAVCPWNRFAQAGRMMQSHARQQLEQPDLLELLSLDEAGFKSRFAGTPLLRAKRKGLLRNVCVALGNIGDKRALPALRRAIDDPEPLVSEHAVWAWEQVCSREACGSSHFGSKNNR